MDAADLGRIRLVTSRYQEMQGLRQLMLLPCCLTAFWSRPYIESLHDAGTLQAVAGFFLQVAPWLVVLAARPFLDRYYKARFGSVSTGLSRWSVEMLGWAVLILAGFVIDMSTRGQAKPSALLVAGTLIALHVAWRDWPWRGYSLAAALACAVGAWLTAASPMFRVDDLDALLRVPLTIFMCAHTVTAWFDHRLLLRTLPPNPEASTELLTADHADSL